MSITDYIKQTWHLLTRSHQGLAVAAIDPKLHPLPDGRWPVYLAASEDLHRIEEELRKQMRPADFQKIELRTLPSNPNQISQEGLLYLPKPYVVPGGRLNEMYGWDSFFIQMGLLRDGKLTLAQDMAENFLYEIREYGKILNANRTYYLTRSQPPFLTQMLLAVFEKTQDRKWLGDALPAIEKYYTYWTTEPHLTAATGLSRYFDPGSGPAPEVLASEHDAKGHTDFDLVKKYFRSHKIPDYDPAQYYDAARDQLTPLFYTGDRSMRESGFDPSSRFGPFSADIIHYNPVCLNSLLYLMEIQTGDILRLLNREADRTVWSARAKKRAELVNQLLWDEHDGFYYDYDFVHSRVRQYPFLTTFYPLWAGFSSRETAARVVHNLAIFERAGGLQTSSLHTGDQWDAPFGWAPLQWIAVQGLRRYGYKAEADRVSMRFLTLLTDDFAKHGTLEEKYDVVHRTSDVSGHLRFGYHSNEAGFGWTNAVFTSLLDQLPGAEQKKLSRQR